MGNNEEKTLFITGVKLKLVGWTNSQSGPSVFFHYKKAEDFLTFRERVDLK